MTGLPPPLEHNEQCAVVDWFESQYPHERIFAVPNGGERNARVGRKLRSEGVRPGVPDLCIPCLGPLWVEMKRKRPIAGTPSKEQREWHDYLRAIGQRVIVARGADEAIWEIKAAMTQWDADKSVCAGRW